jgi:hypothetical protein
MEMCHDHLRTRPFAFIRFDRDLLDNLSDRGLKDIGIEPYRRDFDTVKPFWMP